jgi:hypothetical protein
MVVLGVKAEAEARFGIFGDNANLMQDRCPVYAEHTICSKIILDAPDGTRNVGHAESHFGPFEEGVSVGAT